MYRSRGSLEVPATHTVGETLYRLVGGGSVAGDLHQRALRNVGQYIIMQPELSTRVHDDRRSRELINTRYTTTISGSWRSGEFFLQMMFMVMWMMNRVGGEFWLSVIYKIHSSSSFLINTSSPILFLPTHTDRESV